MNEITCKKCGVAKQNGAAECRECESKRLESNKKFIKSVAKLMVDEGIKDE